MYMVEEVWWQNIKFRKILKLSERVPPFSLKINFKIQALPLFCIKHSKSKTDILSYENFVYNGLN